MADAVWNKIYFLENNNVSKNPILFFRMGFFYKIQFGAVIFSNICEAFVRAICSNAAAVFIKIFCSLIAAATTVHPSAQCH